MKKIYLIFMFAMIIFASCEEPSTTGTLVDKNEAREDGLIRTIEHIKLNLHEKP